MGNCVCVYTQRKTSRQPHPSVEVNGNLSNPNIQRVSSYVQHICVVEGIEVVKSASLKI